MNHAVAELRKASTIDQTMWDLRQAPEPKASHRSLTEAFQETQRRFPDSHRSAKRKSPPTATGAPQFTRDVLSKCAPSAVAQMPARRRPPRQAKVKRSRLVHRVS